ncbi:tricorn protease domain 2-containing protein [Ramaria rubella]|nr:tricorn protease domain 2-containing protein [Ramaria rubella]
MAPSNLVFNSTGTFIAVGDQSLGFIIIWSAIDGSLAAGPFVHESLFCIAYSPSGESIASADRGAFTAKIWNIKTGIAQATITFSGPCRSIAYSPNETLLVSCFGRLKNNDKSVRTEVAVGANLGQYSLDGKYAVVGGTNGEVVVQHAGSGTVAYGPYKIFTGQVVTFVTTMALSPNGKYVTVAEGSGYKFQVLDLLTGKDVGLMLEHPGNIVRSASFSPDGAFLAYTSIGPGVRICNLLKHGYSM